MKERICNRCKDAKDLARTEIKISPYKNYDNIKIDAYLCERCTSIAVLAFSESAGVTGQSLESLKTGLGVIDGDETTASYAGSCNGAGGGGGFVLLAR